MANPFISSFSLFPRQGLWIGIFLITSIFLGISVFYLPPYLMMAAIAVGILIVYLLLNPDKAFYLSIFTIPFIDRVRVLPVSFSLNEVLILFTLIVCVAHALIREQRFSLRTELDPWIAVLTIVYFLAGFFSEGDTGLLGSFKVFEAFFFYYLTVYLLRTKQVTRSKILKVVLFTALFQASLGIFQSVTSIGADFQSNRGYLGYLGLGSNHVWHGRGTTWHFNTLGNYLATNFALFLPLFFFAVKDRVKALPWAAILLLGIITTYSRGSILGITAGAIYFLAVSQKTWQRSLIFVGAFILFVLFPAAYTLGNSSYVETVSYSERLTIWQVPIAAITSSAKAFWLGSGLNSYAFVAWPFIPAHVPQTQYMNWFAHNFYLLTVIEVGVIGAAILFGFLIFICLAALRKFKTSHGFFSAYGLAISSCIITVFFVSIFDHTFASPHFKVFIFLLLGLLYVKRRPVSQKF